MHSGVGKLSCNKTAFIIIIIIININKVTIISEMMKSETATRILQLARRYVYATGDVVREAAQQQQQQQPGVTIDRAAGRPAQLHIGKQVGERASDYRRRRRRRRRCICRVSCRCCRSSARASTSFADFNVDIRNRYACRCVIKGQRFVGDF